MKDRGEMSARKAWLIVLASLIDDAALLVLIFLALRFFHVEITWPIILVAGLAVVIFFIIMHKAVVPAIRRRKTTGAEGMMGMTGKVTQVLKPQGVIKIKDEYWEAKAINGGADIGEDVEVIGINGLILEVKRKEL
jgi:membrane protein implicated in regulation of membrane protease activity